MNKKIAFISFAVLAICAFTVWAVTSSGPAVSHSDNAVNMEQVSTDKLPADCDPSNCTPEQAAKCPHPVGAETSATAHGSNDADCPATKECPPSKCQGDKKAESSSATL